MQALIDTGIADFIKDEPVNEKAQLWVLGHGFAGALAKIFSLAMLQILELEFNRIPIKVYPMTFASPCMYNFVFARYYDSLLPYTLRVNNIHDPICMLWSEIKHIKSFYEEGASCPETLSLSIDECQEHLAKLEAHMYHHTNLKGLAITAESQGNFDFFEELRAQHDISTYATTLDAKPV